MTSQNTQTEDCENLIDRIIALEALQDCKHGDCDTVSCVYGEKDSEFKNKCPLKKYFEDFPDVWTYEE